MLRIYTVLVQHVRKKEKKKFIQIKSIWYYNVYIHKLKPLINYSN